MSCEHGEIEKGEYEIAALAAVLAAHNVNKKTAIGKDTSKIETPNPWKIEGRRMGLRQWG